MTSSFSSSRGTRDLQRYNYTVGILEKHLTYWAKIILFVILERCFLRHDVCSDLCHWYDRRGLFPEGLIDVSYRRHDKEKLNNSSDPLDQGQQISL